MSLEIFHVTDENPNVRVGGGGCLCSPTSCGEGPYTVFTGGDMESPVSPFAVVCADCLRGAVDQIDGKAAVAEDQ